MAWGNFSDFGAWLEHERAASELRSALSDIRSRADLLDIDLDEIDLPSGGKRFTESKSAAELYELAADLRSEVKSAEYEYINQVSENGTASEIVEAMLDLATNKREKDALRARLNASSDDILQLSDELINIDKIDRESWLRSETRGMIAEKRAAEQAMLRDSSFMASVEKSAKKWIGG